MNNHAALQEKTHVDKSDPRMNMTDRTGTKIVHQPKSTKNFIDPDELTDVHTELIYSRSSSQDPCFNGTQIPKTKPNDALANTSFQNHSRHLFGSTYL